MLHVAKLPKSDVEHKSLTEIAKKSSMYYIK